MRHGLAAGMLLVTGLTAAPAVRAEGRVVFVLPFVAENTVKEEILGGLRALWMDEGRKIPGVELPELTTRALGIVGECRGEMSCLGRGLTRLGASQFVFTVVERGDKGGYLLNQTLHDGAGGAQQAEARTLVKGKGPALEKAARRAAMTLLAPELLTGAVSVEVTLPGAEVSVDGTLIGKSPLRGAYGGLREGPHKVRVTKDGYEPFDAEVDVAFDETAGLDVRLVRSARTEFKPSGAAEAEGRGFPTGAVVMPVAGLIVSAVLTSLAAAVAGGLAGGTFYQARALEERANRGQLIFPDDAWMLWIWRVLAVATVVALGVMGVVAVVSAGATAAGTGVMLALHFLKPAPVPVRAKEYVPVKPPREPSAAPPAQEPPPAPPPPTRKQKRPVEQTEETLPEGE
ncbi:MAG: PEGA domain-containing protein [Deltaproteobacteria bacterium]|nr:PEGA domain-containing protein [Deltaproteobacteria bacterium]